MPPSDSRPDPANEADRQPASMVQAEPRSGPRAGALAEEGHVADPAGRLGVNSRHSRASNRKARQDEAEQDRALIEQAKLGDRAAFRSLLERHQRRAFAIAYSLVHDEQDAREIVQEAFLRVHRGLASFHGGSSFFTWLYRIVTNLSIDLIRKPGRHRAEWDDTREVEEDAEIPLLSRLEGSDPLEVVRRGEIAGRIQTALDALPPYHRSVILMRELEGLSYEEMAEVMGVSKGTIMSRLFHARQKLQRALCDCYEEQVGRLPREAAEEP
jgi:RNA polymerase sigma-70 factor (ECF subfamily)